MPASVRLTPPHQGSHQPYISSQPTTSLWRSSSTNQRSLCSTNGNFSPQPTEDSVTSFNETSPNLKYNRALLLAGNFKEMHLWQTSRCRREALSEILHSVRRLLRYKYRSLPEPQDPSVNKLVVPRIDVLSVRGVRRILRQLNRPVFIAESTETR